MSPKYNEAAVRQDFIDRFWMALGWDVTHETQKNPREREVTVEKRVNVEGRGKRADYSFAVAPNFGDVRFFVEAKKPGGQLSNAQDYFQTVRYGWNAHTPVAVLTDFAALHILDCRYKPDVAAVLQYAALEKFHYTDYADEEKFRSIYHLFAREAVADGALERYAAALPKPGRRGQQQARVARGIYQSVDESFLQELDSYRAALAHAFKQANPQLDSAQLTEITQRTLDRLVFMRFLEDKLIEQDELIEPLAMSAQPWAEFVRVSVRLNGVYNGIIFRRHDILDAPTFRVDARVFQSICHDLSHVRSVYAFHLIPIHILGSIYERFLGKTIEAGAQGAAVVDKPEVRKAGGVYYTPEYIVRYIVAQTVGQLIAGRTPEQIRALRFADISCGSGSFLLGVYDLLLRYHTTYYNRNKRTHAEGVKAGCLDAGDGALRLSLLQKRTILLNNIYGVDVDAQAVEVAQLSLYLKLLEDETTATAHAQQLALRAALLPSLGDNIKSGNSLVDWDILDGELFDRAEELKVNPMSFKQEFTDIMRAGGFDAIVGNPPYGAQFSDAEKIYIREKFESYRYKYDSYIYFIERALELLKSGGYVSFITPEVWLKLENSEPLRRFIFGRAAFERLKVCGENVFAQAVVNTIVFVLRAGEQASKIEVEKENEKWIIPSEVWRESNILAIDYRLKPGIYTVVRKIKNHSSALSNYGEAIQGITAYDKYRGQDPALIKRRGYHFDHEHDDTCGKWLAGMDVSRYMLNWSGEWLSYGPWLGAPRDPRFFDGPRLLFREIPGERKRIQATIADETFYHGHSVTPFKMKDSVKVDLRYLLGIANSKLVSWHGGLTLSNFGKDIFPKLNPQDIKDLPVPNINLSNPAEKKQHDDIVRLVNQMMAAKRELAGAATERERALYERKCAALDRQIDELVYALYGLTAAEVALVETA